MASKKKPSVTFIEQNDPVDEYGRALYAVTRSILRAYIDSISDEDLSDLNTPLAEVRMRQFAKIVRLERNKGMRGDGFEWAVHEALLGGEPTVAEPVSAALRKASTFVKDRQPSSLLFGYERAKYLGFLDAVVTEAGNNSFLLPEGSGRPFSFGTWVSEAARGQAAEPILPNRIKQIWKTDLFLSTEDDNRYFAATVKSNRALLEGGRGLRVAIVPAHKSQPFNIKPQYDRKLGLWIVTLADPNGFMGLFNDAYSALAHAVCTLGKHPREKYYLKPSAKAQLVQEQLEKFPDAPILEIEEALDAAAQKNLVIQSHALVSVNAPSWLHMKELAPKVIAPKPSFTALD